MKEFGLQTSIKYQTIKVKNNSKRTLADLI